MKRMLVALAMLIAVAVLCFTSIRVETDSVQYLLTSLDNMEDSFRQQDYAECQRQADRFVEDFEEYTRYFPLFLRHSDISRIEEIAIPLPVLLRQGDTQHFAAELVRCRNQLETLYQIELPRLENIL